MSHQEWSCLEHGQPIISFCISDHKCPDRRLCPKCLYSSHNNIDRSQIPLVDDFQKQLSEKLNKYTNGQPCDLLKLIKQFQDQINKIFQEIQTSAQFLLKNFEEIGKDILEIQQKLKTNSFLNFCESDRNLMIGIVRDNLIQKKYDEQHSFGNQIQNIEKQLKSQFEESINQLSPFTTTNNREKIDDNVSIEGMKIMGLRQGDYYYCYENGTKELAGTYKLNLKNGIWKLYCGEKYKKKEFGFNVIQQKQKIYQIVNYKDGSEVKNVVQENQKQNQNIIVELYGYEQQIKLQGNLLNGIKIGKWQYVYNGNTIGGGEFDKQGVKVGIWQECDQMYNYDYQVIFSGEYRNGLRFGQWTTLYENNKIGGGNYDDKGVKSGNWTDLHENFWGYCQVIYSGEYRNGLRFGQWTTLQDDDMIGGGHYDDKGVKSGNWTDLHENFWGLCQVIQTGEYRNGLRFGQWTTFFKKNKIGGGNYDDKGVKSGNWTDLHENFEDDCQVIYSGEYKNGLRFGQWTTLDKNNKIGGGNYDDKGVKTGNWTDLHENFEDYCQVIYSGEYKNGLRFGQWNEVDLVKNKIRNYKYYE